MKSYDLKHRSQSTKMWIEVDDYLKFQEPKSIKDHLLDDHRSDRIRWDGDRWLWRQDWSRSSIGRGSCSGSMICSRGAILWPLSTFSNNMPIGFAIITWFLLCTVMHNAHTTSSHSIGLYLNHTLENVLLQHRPLGRVRPLCSEIEQVKVFPLVT